MKNTNQFYKCLASSGLVLAIAAMALVSSPTQADQVKGAQLLIGIRHVEDLQKIDVGDVIVMSCPKCKTTYSEVVTKGTHAAEPEELKTVGIHLCSSCDTRLVMKGEGKHAEDTLVHTCKKCGSEDVSCCVLKKGAYPTLGMEDDKK